MFSLKGPRYAVNRRVLSEAGDSIKRFLDSGVTELGAPPRAPALAVRAVQEIRRSRFRQAFLNCCPRLSTDTPCATSVEVRHDSFNTPDFLALLRKFSIPVVFAEHDKYPAIADIVGDFVYARLQKGDDKLKAGYPPKALDAWAARAKTWAQGGEPKDLPRIDKTSAKKEPRDVFLYFIHEAKIRAPAAAMAC